MDIQSQNLLDNESQNDFDIDSLEESSTVTGSSGIDGADEGEIIVPFPREGVSIEKNDRSLSEFYRWYQEKRLIIDPEWQRSYVWDNKRASKLMESFLVDIPVPVIYLAKTEGSKYEVIDGVQRLTSIFKFFSDEIILSSLELLDQYNKMKFSELPDSVQNKIKDATLRTFELSPQTSKNLLFVIFERLNTGGVALNEMEIRNCIFRGSLNNTIKKLTANADFLQSVNQKDIGRRMNDRSLILRFLAFYEKTYSKAQNGLKEFLNDFLATYRDAQEVKLKDLESKFKLAMKASKTVFGGEAFRIRRVDQHGGSEWAPRVNASIFQIISVSFTNYDLNQITRRADQIFEEYLDLITTDNTWIDAVTKSTGDAAKIRYSFQTWIDRLSKVMEGSLPLDNQRIFSRSLKKELYQQNPTCSICNQDIKVINDAALDHEEHYWRGGRTIPSNARLVHRLCNLKRKK